MLGQAGPNSITLAMIYNQVYETNYYVLFELCIKIPESTTGYIFHSGQIIITCILKRQLNLS